MVMSLLLCMFACTTEVDICMNDSHLHLAEVDLSYDLSKFPEEERALLPDSMIVVAYRVVRSWKCSFMTSVVDGESSGRYIYNKPYGDISELGNAVLKNRTASGGADESERLFVKRGEYRFITFNNTLTDEMFENIPTSGWFRTDGVIDSVIYNKEIELFYRSHNLKSDLVEKYGKSWVDFNPYTTYIARSNSPVYFQYSDVFSLDDTRKNDVTLAFEKKTQDFEIRFSINRDSVVVDKIIAEMAGVPRGMNLMTGKLDFSKTYKTLFEVHEAEITGDTWSGVTKYAGNISVMGLVSSNSPELNTGPGIMQLAIYTYTYNNKGQKRSKIFHVGINMYNTMNRYGYVLAGSDEKIVLEIEHELNIKKNDIYAGGNNGADDSESDSGIDHWIIRENLDIDI